jgi:hypothetical protein
MQPLEVQPASNLGAQLVDKINELVEEVQSLKGKKRTTHRERSRGDAPQPVLPGILPRSRAAAVKTRLDKATQQALLPGL